jgi:signal transduction histidine kinase
MGIACLLADPARRRNRLFAALCGALALWTLGVAANRAGVLPLGGSVWGVRLFLFGSCLAAPLGLHLSLSLCWPRRKLPVYILASAYSLAGGLWIAAVFRKGGIDRQWNTAAMILLGLILLLALAVLLKKTLSLAPGPERRAFRFLTFSTALVTAGGLSDFFPRGVLAVPKFGPISLMIFLLVVAAMVLRYRFLDVDRFLAQAVALMAGAGLFALVLFGVMKYTRPRFLPLMAVSLLAMFLLPATTRILLVGARELLARPNPVTEAFLKVSRQLPDAHSPDSIWKVLEDGREQLPEGVEVVLYLRKGRDAYRPRQLGRTVASSRLREPLASDHGVVELLKEERCPLHLVQLADEIRESDRAGRRARAGEALAWLQDQGFTVLAPLFADNELRGWLGVGGIPGRWVTADLAASIQAVGHQTVASLERLEALEASERRRALAAVGEMAAGLAHEIRNPLSAIRGASQALNPDASPEQAKEMLEVIDEESDRLGRVVGEFLEYARPASPRREPVDLLAIASLVTRDAGLAGFNLKIEIVPADPVEISGDPDQIRRVFENLVRNAWEAGGDEASLTIATGMQETGIDHGESIWIDFQDDGPGISPDDLPKLFQPFYTTRASGTGLGLALIHRIMETHGGSVQVSSLPGAGATFRLLFPAKPQGE